MENVLTVSNLNKYFGRRKILDNINLEVKAGEVMGFIGPNGAGKTTAIKVILGFLSDDGGSVNICGYDLKKDYENALGCAGGIVENPDMYKQFSGMLNLEMYARTHEGVTKERINEVVRLVGLENRINDKVKKYSLGMKQRLGVAMALLHNPKLLILDEPMNGLDPAGIKELRDIVTTLAHENGVGVLISSHQLAEMQNMCDRAAIIVSGRIVCEDTLEALNRRVTGGSGYIFETGNPMKTIAVIKKYLAENQPVKTADDSQNDNGNGAATAEPSAQCNPDDGSVLAQIETKDVPAIVRALVTEGVDVFAVRKTENSLEDAFIAITGGGNTIA